MSRPGTTLLRWRLQRADGSFEEPVQFGVDDDTAVYLRDVWERIKKLPRGNARSVLVADLRVQLDLLAVGARPVPPESGSFRSYPRGR